jgi:PmbA protein
MSEQRPDPDFLSDFVAKACKAGADAADAIMIDSVSSSTSWRMGRNEGVERAESGDLGLRVLIGHGQAIVSSNDLQTTALNELIERAVTMARNAPEDPHCGLPESDQLTQEVIDLDLADSEMPSSATLLELAALAEDAARAVDGVTNTEGAGSNAGKSAITLANSAGFAGGYLATNFGISASVIAGSDTQMERDYEYCSAHHFSDLEPASDIGQRAGERAVRRLNPRKAKSQQVPVVFDPRLSGGFPRLLAGLISGAAIARGTSVLKDKMDKQLFAIGVDIIDDPLRERGLSSRPFDGEGVPGELRKIVENGVLTTWLLDTRSARQLKLRSTGHAVRGTSTPPSPGPTNLYMSPGEISRDDLIGNINSGFYVTEMMGMSFNSLTGDYSRGASGFWIENGELAHPVNEMTVAGNIEDMFLKLTPADDLTFRYGVNAPTLRVDGMTVAGV